MGLDLTVQDPACGRDGPMRGSQKTDERLLSLQLKLKRFPLVVLEVSELVPSTSGSLGHRISEGVGFKMLQSSDCLSFRTGHTMPIDNTVFF